QFIELEFFRMIDEAADAESPIRDVHRHGLCLMERIELLFRCEKRAQLTEVEAANPRTGIAKFRSKPLQIREINDFFVVLAANPGKREYRRCRQHFPPIQHYVLPTV